MSRLADQGPVRRTPPMTHGSVSDEDSQLSFQNDVLNSIVGGSVSRSGNTITYTPPSHIADLTSSAQDQIDAINNLGFGSYQLASDKNGISNGMINTPFSEITSNGSSISANSPSNGYFQLNAAGTYQISFTVMLVQHGGNMVKAGSVYLEKNANRLSRSSFNDSNANGDDEYSSISISGTMIADFAANDTLRLYVDTNPAVAVYGLSNTDGARTWICINRLT